mgnify:FL=1
MVSVIGSDANKYLKREDKNEGGWVVWKIPNYSCEDTMFQEEQSCNTLLVQIEIAKFAIKCCLR